MMKNTFLQLSLLVIMLLLLIGCKSVSESDNDIISSDNNSNEQETIDQSLTENEPDYMQTVEITKTLEEAIISVNNFTLSVDELDVLFAKHMKSGVYDKVMTQFEYGPSLITVINNGERSNKTIMLNDVKGMSVQEIKEVFKEDIDNFKEEFYGNIVYEPFQVSEAYDDGDSIYVFVKQQLKVDKMHHIEVQDVTVYKRYTFFLNEGHYIITDLSDFAYSDAGIASTWHEEEKAKFELYRGTEIWKE